MQTKGSYLPAESRSATEKRARTRALVLQAAIECVLEVGAAQATASQIAARCNLSLGVIQYHFGDRAGLFLAALEHALSGIDEIATPPIGDSPTLRDRVESLIERSWQLLSADTYRAILEIQFALANDPARGDAVHRLARTVRIKVRDVWRSALSEQPPEAVDKAQRLAISALRGLALEKVVENRKNAYGPERRLVAAAALETLLKGQADAPVRHSAR